jgi:hypothetical protein
MGVAEYGDLLNRPKELVRRIDGTYRGGSSSLSYYTTLLKLLTAEPQLDKRHPKARPLIKLAAETHQLQVNTKYTEARASPRQQQNYVSTQELEEKTDGLMRSKEIWTNCRLHIEVMLLALLRFLPPMRLDGGTIEIFRGPAPASAVNYITLAKPARLRLAVWTKTGLDNNEPFSSLLPPVYTSFLIKSLKFFPRKFLLTDVSFRPFSKANSYGRFIQRTFLKHFGRNCGISLYRHAFVNQFATGATPLERKRIARSMLHSVETQKMYYPLVVKQPRAPAGGKAGRSAVGGKRLKAG